MISMFNCIILLLTNPGIQFSFISRSFLLNFERMTQSIVWYTCLTVEFFYSLIQEYSLALWQCYDRYLLHFGNINVEEITDVDSFRLTFFPEGFDSENAGLTVSLKNITSPHNNHWVLRSKTSKTFLDQ